ncbi:retroviral-like aspartic protease family protein [Myxococcota bacterium]|nr:retroviral-like aspartic protease family protein [Myxococcota bacterium]MBU1534473.1 retroviral-like aspartic protease family protein [Myxococcota bacterium]
MKILLALMVFGLLSCDDEGTSFHWEGTPGTPVYFDLGSLTPEISVTMNSTPATESFVLDTGSPINLADVGSYSEAPGLYSKDVTALGLTFPGLPVVFEDWIHDSAPVSGILGASVLIHFNWEIDYPNQLLTLYDTDFPQDLSSDTPVSFMLKGGGRYRASNGDILDVGATRHLVWLEIEGERVLALLDTGASYMVMAQSFFNLLGGMEGRADLGTQEMFTVNGVVQAQLTNLSEMNFEDAPIQSELTNIATAIMPDAFFSELQVETGKVVEILLGGSYLSHFRLRFATDDRIIWASPPTLKKSSLTPSGRLRMPPVLETVP